jgi:hypothetical protein
MMESQTHSVYVDRPWREVYEAIWKPEQFPKWASGLSKASLQQDGDGWKAQGPAGPVRIRFTDHNDFGVMDHYVETGDGSVVYIPLRVIANGAGAEVALTLFRQKGMSDAQYAADAQTVQSDLAALASSIRNQRLNHTL